MERVPNETDRFKKILVATDFSQNAANALNWAVAVAKAHESSIELVHAIETLAMESVPLELQDAVTRSLSVLVGNVQKEGVEASSRFEKGKAWEVVEDTTRAIGADLIVVGTHGRRGISHALLGSVAEKIVRTASCPVLTISNACRKEAVET